MQKKILFLEDLYNFYSNNYKKSVHYSAEKTGKPIVVQAHGTMHFDESDNSTEGLTAVHLQACHIDENLNGSSISKTVMEAALPSFKNRPLLGYIHIVNGQPEFYSHNMHEDENGEIVYDEVPVGIIPESCDAKLVYDEEKDKTYVEVDGYIFDEYSKAKEILERDGECACSVELAIRELSFNAKSKVLEIEDFFFMGVTALGKTPEGNPVMPGMANSNIKLKDFTTNNSMFSDFENKINELQERLSLLESACSDTQSLEEGGQPIVENVNEIEEITEVEEVTTEESTEEVDTESIKETVQESSEENPEVIETESAEDDSETESTENFEKMIRSYEISHEDVKYALYQLLAPFEDADNDWYFINSVYDSYFTYESWFGDKIFGQAYIKDGDNVSFDGERYNLHRELLTDAEYAELQNMRSNYAALVEFKENIEKNEAHAARENVLNSEKYSILSQKDDNGNFTNDSFAKLYSEMDNYNIEELEKEVKVLLAEYALNGGKFAVVSHEEPKQNKIKIGSTIFGNKKDDKDSFLQGLLNLNK